MEHPQKAQLPIVEQRGKEASLKEGEDEELEKAYRRMSNFRKIAEGIEKVHDLLGGDGDENALSFVSSANGELSQIIRFDDELGKISDELSEAESLLSDISYSVSSYISRMEFDEEEFFRELEVMNELSKDETDDATIRKWVKKIVPTYQLRNPDGTLPIDTSYDNKPHKWERTND